MYRAIPVNLVLIITNHKKAIIMRTIEINIYQFNELSEEAKEKALLNLSDINIDYEWWSSTYEDAKQIGLNITSFDLDRNRHCKGVFDLSASEVAQNILNEHGEDCRTYKTADAFMAEWDPIFSDYMDESSENYESAGLENKLMEIEAEFLNSLLSDYAMMLQEECDYLQSDEAIIETIEANEYEFNEEGELV